MPYYSHFQKIVEDMRDARMGHQDQKDKRCKHCNKVIRFSYLTRAWFHVANESGFCQLLKAEPSPVCCFYCGVLTTNTGTARCDSCYELEKRLTANSETVSKIINRLVFERRLRLKLVFPHPGYSEIGRMTQSVDGDTLTFEFGQ